MKKECFSCQKSAPKTVQDSLRLYKKIYEQTGRSFYFYKESENGKIKVADSESFKVVLPKFKNNKGANWCHIAEFGAVENDNVFGDSENAKLKATKREGKR